MVIYQMEEITHHKNQMATLQEEFDNYEGDDEYYIGKMLDLMEHHRDELRKIYNCKVNSQ